MSLRFAVVAVVALAACSSPQTVTEPVAYSLSQAADSVRISVGETISVEGTRIKFVTVPSDSRCPMDAICVWEGDGVAQFTAQQGSDTQLLELHTRLDPKTGTAHGYRFELLLLDPYPRASSPTRPDAYAAWIRIVRAS